VSKIILSTGPCKKLLEYDGIASNRLVIREQTGKLMLSCKNVPALKEKISGLGISITIIKNLDEYQFLICKFIPDLSDKNIFKFKFQKIRLLIFLFAYKLTNAIIRNNSQTSNSLSGLNKSGNGILQETSELIQVFRESSVAENSNIDKSKNIEAQINLKIDHFVHFDRTESEINRILFTIYGFNLDKEKTGNYRNYDEGNYNEDDDEDD
jgi:hypothetical protein